METKIAQKPRRPKKSSPKKCLILNEMKYKYRREIGNLTSTASGNITSFVGFSIQGSTEYSNLSAIFTTVKLLNVTVTITPLIPTSTASAHSRIILSTRWDNNENTAANPANIDGVQNGNKVQTMLSSSIRPLVYRPPLPKSLDFAAIGSDAPSTVTPWAGSPGAVMIWGNGFSNSTLYFKVDMEGVYHVRGRN